MSFTECPQSGIELGCPADHDTTDIFPVEERGGRKSSCILIPSGRKYAGCGELEIKKKTFTLF